MSALAARLAMLATSGSVLLVLLLFLPSLQAPFLVPKFAALELSASLGLVAFALQRATTGRPRWARPVAVGAVLVLATSLLAWIAAAGKPVGAPYAVAAIARWGSLLGLACSASALDEARGDQHRSLEAVTIAAAIVALVGLLQHLEVLPLQIPVISKPGSTFGNRNIAAEVIAMALPLGLAAAAGAKRSSVRRVILAALVLDLAYLAVTRARGAWLGGACGVGAMLWMVKPRLSRTSVAMALGSTLVATVAASLPGRFNPHDAGDRKRYSGVVELVEGGVDAQSTALKSRLGLWRRTVAMVRDHPLLGVGPGNWPVVFPGYAEPGAALDGVLSATLAPRQAHDDALERAAETGIVGLVALGWLAAGTAIAARRTLRSEDERTRTTAAGAAGALIALVVLSLVGFPFEMPGTIAIAGLALGLVAVPFDGATIGSRPRALSYVPVLLALAVWSAAAVRAERNVSSNWWLGAAERDMRRDHGIAGAREALGALNRALETAPEDYRTNLRASQMLLLTGRPLEAALAARRALRVEPYAPNACAALAADELAAGDHAAARHDATEALALLHDYPFALHLRAQAAEQEGDLPAAQADRQRLLALTLSAHDRDTANAARALVRGQNEPRSRRQPLVIASDAPWGPPPSSGLDELLHAISKAMARPANKSQNRYSEIRNAMGDST